MTSHSKQSSLDRRNLLLGGIALVGATIVTSGAAFGQSNRFDALANLPFEQNRPTPETAKTLMQELEFQQATQAYLWAMPLINTLGMKFGSETVFGAGYNILPVWKERLDTKTLVTTPNSDVLYAMSYVDMGETGPVVFEAPPNLQGILLDFWQRPIPVDGGKFAGDVGLPGPDAGKGGKFLVLPPGYSGDVPTGYYVYRSGTNNLFIFLRAFYQDPKNLSPAVKVMEQVKVYPLNLPEAERKPMKYPNASGVPANMLPRSDATAYEQLKWIVDREGQNLADADGLGLLANIGIVKDRPFEPDADTKTILNAAAKTAYKMSRVIGRMTEIGGRDLRIWKDRRWLNPANNVSQPGPDKTIDLAWRNTKAGFTEIEPRVWMFTDYYSISPGMVSLSPGKGAFYGIAFNDTDDKPLSGDSSYKVTLPPNVPVALFWSLTLYEAENASGLATEARRFPSLGSRDKPAQNADGTTDLYIGPKPPAGKEANWLATAPGRGFFAILRLYGPEEAAVNYSWKPGDLQRMN
ncbi:DUF1254 domain-containing protein [Bradyrhizobium japonicum]|uniref:DUF1254 domain-containing protein n=1 Tax=Bradyrhizobium japonicum TaxID=375 RepID=UPI001BA84558|nr:DUF1254 domain-containing protein [Bradyrhizobium japonicum]MBR0914769.1 DUF1254 domain-containing protein [Bradyrhizobium japonicum]